MIHFQFVSATKMADSEVIEDDNLTKTADIIVDINSDDENVEKICVDNEHIDEESVRNFSPLECKPVCRCSERKSSKDAIEGREEDVLSSKKSKIVRIGREFDQIKVF
jgi:hypothetical protein